MRLEGATALREFGVFASLLKTTFRLSDSVVTKEPGLKVTVRPLVGVLKGAKGLDSPVLCVGLVDSDLDLHGSITGDLAVAVGHMPNVTVLIRTLLDLLRTWAAYLLVQPEQKRDLILGTNIREKFAKRSTVLDSGCSALYHKDVLFPIPVKTSLEFLPEPDRAA